jgi:hypothetical protein
LFNAFSFFFAKGCSMFSRVHVIKHQIVYMWVCLSRLLPLFLLNNTPI